jgi:hypothetical protein
VRLLHCALLGTVALGCGHDPADDGAVILQGRWGSIGHDAALLIGLSVGAELQFVCSAVSTEAPLELDLDGNFSFTGRYNTSMAQVGGEQPRARVEGRLQGETVALTFDLLGDGLPGSDYTLERGVDPHFEDLPPGCPQ